MPHRLPKLSSLALLLFLNLVLTSPALFGRDEQGGNSLWGLDLEDVFGAGAAGLNALNRLWDFSTAPGVTTTPSGVPSEPPDERPYQPPETPSPVAFPPFNPTAIKPCAMAGEGQGSQVDRLAVEQSWWQVEQEPETGRPVISACDLPKEDDNDAYIVREIRLEEGRQKSKWPAAILISDPVNNVHFRYNVIRIGTSTLYTYQKIPGPIFIRQGKLVKLGYVRRRGWLVGAGQSKEVALKWFEDEIMGTTKRVKDGYARIATSHYSATWITKVFTKADQSGSPFWISDRFLVGTP